MEHRVSRAAGHPIAPPCGMVATARLNLYAKIGPGPHPCHWCDAPVDWMPGASLGTPGLLIADHLDWDATNDNPSNLAPSCNPCNAHRRRNGKSRRIAAGEVTVERRGVLVRATERTCETCAAPFLAANSQIKVGRGRFCSRSCARKQPRAA